ncbi:ABC transporter ATP-binding protein [Clostridia bacterium]|nr:ABC transporter ATP-binding protein [Clostridia bacterium]
MSYIELKEISKVYQGKKSVQVPALSNVTHSLEKGRSYALVGASGSGKTTLIGILGGILRATGGSYTVDGTRVDTQSEKELCRFRNQRIGLVMQDFALLENSTALDNCLLPAAIMGVKKKEAKKRAMALLEMFDVDRYCGTQVCFLSGGERQRVAIARALMNRPGLLLADEPTGALDSKSAELVADALTRVTSMDATLVIATHNMELAARCEERLTIADGCLVEPTN